MPRIIKPTGIILLAVAAALAAKVITDACLNAGGGLIPIRGLIPTLHQNNGENSAGQQNDASPSGENGYEKPAEENSFSYSQPDEPGSNENTPVPNRYNSGFFSEYLNTDAIRQQSDEDEPQLQKQQTEDGDAKAGECIITLDELKSIEKIGFADKVRGLMIAGKIGKEDMGRLLKIARSGVTSSEMEMVKTILYANLDKKDISSLYHILDRNKNLFAENTVDIIISSLDPEDE